jgi:hypothetical protein
LTSPDEHAQLAASNAARWGKLRDQGIGIQGVYEHWVTACLERLVYRVCGAAEFAELQLVHERWLQAQLDQAEAAVSEMRSKQLRQAIATPGPIPRAPS